MQHCRTALDYNICKEKQAPVYFDTSSVLCGSGNFGEESVHDDGDEGDIGCEMPYLERISGTFFCVREALKVADS